VNARAARQVMMRRRHAPVIAAARRFLRAGERGADHDRVSAGRESFADFSAHVHPPSVMIEIYLPVFLK